MVACRPLVIHIGYNNNLKPKYWQEYDVKLEIRNVLILIVSCIEPQGGHSLWNGEDRLVHTEYLHSIVPYFVSFSELLVE